MRVALLACLVCGTLQAQQPVTSAEGASPVNRDRGGYTVANSLEFGYRMAATDGDLDLYRSSVNFGNGVRLFNGQLRVHATDGTGRLFDEVAARVTGSLGDPYQAHTLRASKARRYRYDGQFRVMEYHNRIASLWRGEHGLRTKRSLQTHDVVLGPGTKFEVLFGFDRNRRSGPGFSSTGITAIDGGLDNRRFLRFQTDLDQRGSQVRSGFTMRILGMALTVMEAFDSYREAALNRDASTLEPRIPNLQPIATLDRLHPIERVTPFTTLALRTERERRVAFSARYTYAGGTSSGRLSERLAVLDPAGSPAMQREAYVMSDASRRHTTGQWTATFIPHSSLIVTNISSFFNIRVDGEAMFEEIGFYRDEFLRVEQLGIRRVSNATEVTFRPVRAWSFVGGYRRSRRDVEAANATRYPDFEFAQDLDGARNSIQSGSAGVRWLPGRNLRASFDIEAGRTDRPLTPTSERRFTNRTGRLRWRHRDLTLGVYFRDRINDNPTELLAYSSKSRSSGAHASWSDATGAMTLDASYNLIALEASAGILNLFAAASEHGPRGRSIYASRIHNWNVAFRAVPSKRVELLAGLAWTRDVGGSEFDQTRAGAERFTLEDALVVSSLPISYASPQFRTSIALSSSLSLNFGWQYYSYSERLERGLGYSAHVGYTSFSYSF